ncbi:hypothetical protein THRCLA_08579 [Thraustotheca clavata]|uniref:AAA+ ATPase domain-containing protein n=1 Tax=Thraustotheca clavata TaxID=74557 RepID=A0A1V9Z4K5_9STRA|nr:hypothetical protein THRCLA_08579 [Thraustotheca clavata]
MQMLQNIDLLTHPYPEYLDQPNLVTSQPLNEDATIKLLLQAYQESELDFTYYEASQKRLANAIASNGSRTLGFDQINNYKLTSYEVLTTWRPQSLGPPNSFHIHEDISEILALLPEDIAKALTTPSMISGLVDIVLDRGRRPCAWVFGTRQFLVKSDRIVTPEDISYIVEKVGGIGNDNRASLEYQLHRISAIRNRNGDITGLTIRVGRYIEGNVSLIADILAAHEKNILFLGEPGCGKTTIMREVVRQLANKRDVYIVDTSNEIAGGSDIPHPCIGLSRRLMVPSLEQQAAIIMECVENHSPAVMVIDEIGRSNEVEALRICKERDVRMIASARGNLHEILKNKQLSGLFGTSSLSSELCSEPMFQVIVELYRGQYDAWRIILDTVQSVNAVLTNKDCQVQVRRRLKDSNGFLLDMQSL